MALSAALVVAIVLVPADIWHQPSEDAAYLGFNPDLLYVSEQGDGLTTGYVRVSPQQLELVAAPLSKPTVNFVTTPLNEFKLSLDAVIVDSGPGAIPFEVALWSPLTGSGTELLFRSATTNTIVSEVIEMGTTGRILGGGTITRSEDMGSFQLGVRTHLAITVHKKEGVVEELVSSPVGNRAIYIGGEKIRQLMDGPRLSLTVAADPGTATTSARLNNYNLTLLHERFWADRIDDPRASILMLLIGAVGVVFLTLRWAPELVERLVLFRRRIVLSKWSRLSLARRVLLVGAIVLGAYIVPNVLLFRLGSHPFDMSNERLYAYVAARFGLYQLYYLPNLVSFPAAWGGVPYGVASFPYEPVPGYLFSAIGSLAGLGPNGLGPNSASLEYLIKSANLLFAIADAVLIYLICRQLQVGHRWSIAASCLFLFNPAVWFSTSVWGQTHVISLAFVLAAIWLAECNLAFPAWLVLSLGVLTRPQMLVFGLLIGLAFLLRFPWRANLRALSSTAITVFVVLLPFTLNTSPSLPIDILGKTLTLEQTSSSADPATVSLDAYSIWPLVTFLRQGTSGVARAFTPSSQFLFGSISYQAAGAIATIVALAASSLLLVARRRIGSRYIVVVALGIVGFLMLMTGVVATHFLLALPLLILSRRWMGTGSYLVMVIAWTTTTLVPMYGDMANVTAHLNYPLLSPQHNPITQLFLALYQWDRFITFATLINVWVLVWVAVAAVRSKPQLDQLQRAS